MKLIVIKTHASKYPNPICLEKGEAVSLEKRKSEFAGWIWVTTTDGNQGWVPTDYLQLNGNKAVATHKYTARELNTSKGDKLTFHYELKDWGWMETSDGSLGWVPMSTLEPIK